MLMTEGQRKNRASRLKKETADIAAGLGIVIFSILVFIISYHHNSWFTITDKCISNYPKILFSFHILNSMVEANNYISPISS